MRGSLREVLRLFIAYLGLTPPATPQAFEPGLFQRPPIAGRPVTSVAFAPDLRHVVFAIVDADSSGKVATVFHESRRSRGEWTVPTPVLASPGYSSGEGWFSPDGRGFYFSSSRPPAAMPAAPRAFHAELNQGAFGPPRALVLEVPADAGVYYPRLLANGELSFTSRGVGRDDLFTAARSSAGHAKPEPLAGEFNSPQDDWDLIENRAGTLRLWASARQGGQGRTDIWYSRLDSKGRWSAPANLRAVNSAAFETAPALTPDDEALFYLSRVDGTERLYWVRLQSALEKPR